MPRGKPKTIPIPGEEWREAFRGSVCAVRFQLHLSRSMLEFLCAVSDGVQWDRRAYGGVHSPDNWMATGKSLERRGLIYSLQGKEREEAIAKHRDESSRDDTLFWAYSMERLTPAGEKVVELIKLAGMFVDSDAADVRKFKKA